MTDPLLADEGLDKSDGKDTMGLGSLDSYVQVPKEDNDNMTSKTASKISLKVPNSTVTTPLINSKGQCMKCKFSTNIIHESICCFGCNKSFHATCKNKRNILEPTAICTKTFLGDVRPVIAKYGNNSSRWGSFRYFCNDCDLALKQLQSISNESGKSLMSLSDKINESMSKENSVTNNMSESVASVSAGNFIDNTPQQIATQPEITKSQVTLSSLDSQCLTTFLTDMKSDILKSVGELIDQKFTSCSSSNTDFSNNEEVQVEDDSVSNNNVTDVNSYATVVQHDSQDAHQIAGNITTTSVKIASKIATEALILDNPSHPPTLQSVLATITEALFDTPLVFINDKHYVTDKKLTIGFPTKSSKDRAKSILSQCVSMLTYGFMFSDRIKSLPKITVSNIPVDIFSNINENLSTEEFRNQAKVTLLTHIMLKNHFVKDFTENGHVFDVVYINVGERYATAGIKASPQIYNYLMKDCGDQKLFIKNSSCPISDRLLVRQCYKCQKIGHISKDCKDSSVVCMYCSGSHQTSSCQLKSDKNSHRCRNCSLSKNPQIVSKCDTHHSGSKNCPIIIRSQERLKLHTLTEAKN